MKIEIKKVTGKESLKIWVNWLNNKKNSTYTNRKFIKHTIESQKLFIKKKLKSEKSKIFKILYNKVFIGVVEIDSIDYFNKHCDIGFMLGDENYFNKGITTHAVKICLKIAKKMRLRIAYGKCYSENLASVKVFKKNGFKKIALFKNYYLSMNKKKTYDMVYFQKRL